MKGKDIEPGAEHREDGRLVYTVEAVERKRIGGADVMVATVFYEADGGTGRRMFDPEAETGLHGARMEK